MRSTAACSHFNPWSPGLQPSQVLLVHGPHAGPLDTAPCPKVLLAEPSSYVTPFDRELIIHREQFLLVDWHPPLPQPLHLRALTIAPLPDSPSCLFATLLPEF